MACMGWPAGVIQRVEAVALPATLPKAPHWLFDDPMATPLAGSPMLRDRRQMGFEHVGSIVVTIEAGASNKTGFALGLGGVSSALIVNLLGQGLIGANLAEGASLIDRIERLAWFHFGDGGASALAVAALDLALWDVAGKIAELPCAQLAGGPTWDEAKGLDVYATSPDARLAKEQGFRLVKVTLPGGHDLQALERSATFLHEQRAHADAGLGLALDCWGGVEPSLVDAFAALIKPLDLQWVEEPFYRDEPAAIARLAALLPDLTIASGEHLTHPDQFAVLPGDVRLWQPDLRWCGFTGGLRIVETARAIGRRVIPHTSGVYAAHLAGAAGLPMIEYSARAPDGASLDPYHGPHVSGEPPITCGITHWSAQPGFGLTANSPLT